MAGAAASTVDVSREGHVARLTMAFQGKLNLLDRAAIEALTRSVKSLRDEGGLRAVLLSGPPGRPFVGGADVTVLRDLAPGTARGFITALSGAFREIRDLDVPVIAVIEGYALGGGLELAMACDVRVAASDARLGMPEVRVGIPSVIEAALLPRLVGWGRAQYLLYTGEMIDAAEGHRIGLVDVIAPPGALEGTAASVAGVIAGCAPTAIRAQKRLLRAWHESHLDAAIAAGIEEFDRSFRTGEPREGMTAFLERRRARYD
jgi:enoyl-CoA hydratase/carnithine racemase